MTKRNYKSRSLKRVRVKTPGNRKSIHFRRRNPSNAICGISGAKLLGISRKRPGKFNQLSKSKKRPNRKYGGTYSHKVVRSALERAIWQK